MAGDRSGKRLRPKTGILIGLDRLDDAIKAQAFDEKSAFAQADVGERASDSEPDRARSSRPRRGDGWPDRLPPIGPGDSSYLDLLDLPLTVSVFLTPLSPQSCFFW